LCWRSGSLTILTILTVVTTLLHRSQLTLARTHHAPANVTTNRSGRATSTTGIATTHTQSTTNIAHYVPYCHPVTSDANGS
jgi:hypothetical protein